MVPSLYDMSYGRCTKYPRQNYDSEDSAQELMKAFVKNTRQSLSRNKQMMQKPFKRSSSKQKQRQQLIYGNDQFPWEDRFKGKSKQKEVNQKYTSQKEKMKVEQKNIEYEKVFEELCYGNGSDVVSAGIMYKDVVETIVLHLMEKELEMDVYFAKRGTANGIIGKEVKEEEKQQLRKKSIMNEEKTNEKINTKAQIKTSQSNKQEKIESETLMQLADSQLEQSIQVPLKQQYLNKQQPQQKIIQQKHQHTFTFKQDQQFHRAYQSFKRISSPNNIISVIPYKAIPSLFLVSSLNFIIEKTTEPLIVKQFPPEGEKLWEIYKDLHEIAEASKRYLIQEKLLKGMRYVTEVEERLNKVYAKKGFKPKTVTANGIKQESKQGDNAKNDLGHLQFEQRKTSTRSDESSMLQQRKQETHKTASKQK